VGWHIKLESPLLEVCTQKEALLAVWTGKLGGPVADLAKLVGEVTAVEQLPITFEVKGVNGMLRVGNGIAADLATFMGATGQPTALYDTIFTTISGFAGVRRESLQVSGERARLQDRSAGPQRGLRIVPVRGVTERTMLSASYGNTTEGRRALISGSVALLAAAAWLALWMMSGSAHASMHHHHYGANQAVSLSSVLLFVGGWTVMTMAMMLPTTLPILTTFHAIAGQRADRAWLLALVVLGYLATWALFGVVVRFSQLALQQVFAGNAWLQPTGWRCRARMGRGDARVITGM
jgi:hypothetical protein